MEYRITDVYTSILHEPCPSTRGITYMECDSAVALLGNEMDGSTSYYSFSVVCEGALEVVLNTGIVRIQKNDLFIYPPGVQFKVREVSADYRCESIVAEEFFTNDIPQIQRLIGASYLPIFIGQGGGYTHLSDSEASAIKARMAEIKRYIDSESKYREQCLQFEYALLVMDILDMQAGGTKGVEAVPDGIQSMLIEFIRLLQLHFREHHDISFYADKLSVTPIYMSRIIKKATGRTVMDFVNQMLAVEASDLLAHTSRPVAEIARLLNYADSTSFCKFFSRQMHMSPRQYRQSKQLV